MLRFGKYSFSIYFVNMDISLIMRLTIMKIAIHVTETDWEGRVSQNLDTGLSFCFILCRKVDFPNKNLQNTKNAHFCSKNKTRT